MFKIFLVFIMVSLISTDHVSTESAIENYCRDQTIQEGIDMRQLTGMWFAIEVISHLQETKPTEYYQNYEQPTTIDTETCAVVTISDRPNIPLPPMYKNIKKYNQSYSPGYTMYQTEQPYTEYPTNQHYTTHRYRDRDFKHKQRIYYKQYQERKYLSLTWDEDRTTTVYAAYFTYPAGVWFLYEPSADELSPPTVASYIVGNVQVLKAVGNHLVLTFCIRWPEPKLYTVLLARSPKLSKADRSGVHNLLRRLQLEFVQTKRMCLLNSCARFSINYLILFLTFMYYSLSIIS